MGIVTHKWPRKVGILGCATMLAAGCTLSAFSGLSGFSRDDAPGPRAQALLTAAKAHRISMFGDLPGASEAVFFSRAMTSLKQHTYGEVGADFDVDIDVAGQRLVFASTRHSLNANLYVKSVDGVAVTQLTSDPASDIEPAFSPDGTRVAFASNRTGQWDIWIIPVEGGPPVQVTTTPADEVHPSWSPDGSQLVFCSLSAAGGSWELWVTDSNAHSAKRFVGYGLFPEWSPVENTIVYQRARERGSRWFSIWTLKLINGEPRYPTEIASSVSEAMILPTFSPDGRRVAFASVASWPAEADALDLPTSAGVFDIWVTDADGRGKVRLTDGHTTNYAPSFSTDGRVYFTSTRSGKESVWSLASGSSMPPAGEESTLTHRIRQIETESETRARTVADHDGL